MKKGKKNIILWAALGAYFIANLFFLAKFPFMHSDESWLSGLTRTMMHEGPGTTETFFDLLPRYPHAIKTLFHLLQMPLISLFGYNLFSVRLLSLVFGCGALYVIYKFVSENTKSKIFPYIAAAAVALDVQFIYASHFARQEVIILFGMLLTLWYIAKNIGRWSLRHDILTAATVGLMIGIHPNAFIAALAVGSEYIYYMAVEKKLKAKNLALLIGVTAAIATAFIGISYIFDPQFIPHYLKYGDHLGVTMTFAEKLRAIVPFYQKIWLGISGTYYTPFVKVQMALFGAAIIAGIVYSFFDRKTLLFLFPIAAVNIGYIIIGRYSQPSVIFMFVMCWLLAFWLLSRIKRLGTILAAALAAAMLAISVTRIVPYINRDYDEYLEEIRSTVPDGAKVLANLNTEYAFAYDALRDYRNLGYLDDLGIKFADYVKMNGIEYIIYPEEMDYIYEARPVWNIVYGNLYPYYEDMRAFLESGCEPAGEFTSSYAMRIVKFADSKEWSVKIYRVIK